MDVITDHEDRAAARLTSVYRKPRIEGYVKALASEVQELENAIAESRVERYLSSAVGTQLDDIGSVLSFRRGGTATDDAYRALLRARVRILRSQGKPEDLIQAMRLALGAGVAFSYLDEGAGILNWWIDVSGYSATADMVRISDLIASGRMAGSGGFIGWATSAAPFTFFDADGSTWDPLDDAEPLGFSDELEALVSNGTWNGGANY